jgi:hypothetical protein
MIESYALAKGSLDTLTKKVNEMIKRGWRPHGNAFQVLNESVRSALDISMGFPGESVFCQPMVLQKNEKKVDE